MSPVIHDDFEQSGTWVEDIGGFIGAVVDTAGYGGNQQIAPVKKDNTVLYVAGGIALAAVTLLTLK